MTRRIAIISEHAAPVAALGGVDSGGQNVYVGQVARCLAAAGYHVDVFTRRDDPDQAAVTSWENGVRIVRVSAGPAAFVRKEELLPFMGEFTAELLRFCCEQEAPYDLVHEGQQ